MLTKNIRLNKFGIKKNKKKIKYRFLKALNFYKNNKLIKSFSNDYSYDFSQHQIKKFKKFNNYNLVGMGGSSLGTKAIYNLLKPKVKKRFTFIDNLNSRREHQSKEKRLNIIISKSGNTLETISNYSVIKKQKNNLFICENSNNYVRLDSSGLQLKANDGFQLSSTDGNKDLLLTTTKFLLDNLIILHHLKHL